MRLAGRHIVVGIGGGIAAFKAVALVRELIRRGAEVRVAMTQSATKFVGPITFTGLTGRPAIVDLFDPAYAGEVHVELAEWADALVIVPATANLLARAAAGMADDPVLALISCAGTRPLFFAPAMHERMWRSPPNTRNVAQLQRDGATIVGPVVGALASGESGMGRLVEPAAIADAVEDRLARTRDLLGRTVLVTAGPTLEDIDPVRFISNRSSGRMGFAIAAAAVERGARVVLVSGPTEVPVPPGTDLRSARSALDMHGAVMQALPEADAVVMTAAVADYRPKSRHTRKIKKHSDDLTIELVKNPDILLELGTARRGPHPVLVGFAMETNDLLSAARRKLVDKRCDLIVANEAAVGFGGDENQVTFVDAQGDEPLPAMSKRDLAHRILDRVAAHLAKQAPPPKPGAT